MCQAGIFPGLYPVGLSSHWWKGCRGGVCTGRVNQHYWRLFGAIFIGGALRGGVQAMQTALAQEAGVGQIAAGYGSVMNQALSPRLGEGFARILRGHSVRPAFRTLYRSWITPVTSVSTSNVNACVGWPRPW